MLIYEKFDPIVENEMAEDSFFGSLGFFLIIGVSMSFVCCLVFVIVYKNCKKSAKTIQKKPLETVSNIDTVVVIPNPKRSKKPK